MTPPDAALLTDGRKKLNYLFDFAVKLLDEKGIALTYSDDVLDWLLDTDWHTRPLPLDTLESYWRVKVVDAIMEEMVGGKLRAGMSVDLATRGSADTRTLELTLGE